MAFHVYLILIIWLICLPSEKKCWNHLSCWIYRVSKKSTAVWRSQCKHRL